MKKYLLIEMPDFSVWRVPVQVIADNCAEHYAKVYGRPLSETRADVRKLFTSHPFEIEDWAANSMDWADVKAHAVQVSGSEADYQEGWINGRKCLTDNEEQKNVV